MAQSKILYHSTQKSKLACYQQFSCGNQQKYQNIVSFFLSSFHHSMICLKSSLIQKISVKLSQNWNFIYQTHKNFGGNVSAKSCSDHIFTNKSDFRTLHLLNKLFCVPFFWKIFIVLPQLFFAYYIRKFQFQSWTMTFFKNNLFSQPLCGAPNQSVWEVPICNLVK